MAQIFISGSVLAQQHQMVRITVNAMDFILHPATGNINLTTNDRFDSRRLGSLIKINAAIHDTMIRNGNGSLPQFPDPLHHGVNTTRSVQQTVLRMHMQMYKAHFSISFANSIKRRSR